MNADATHRRSDQRTSGSNRPLDRPLDWQVVSGRSVVRIVVALFMMLGCLGSASAVAPSSIVEPAHAMSIDELPAALPAAESSARRNVVRRRRLRRALNHGPDEPRARPPHLVDAADAAPPRATRLARSTRSARLRSGSAHRVDRRIPHPHVVGSVPPFGDSSDPTVRSTRHTSNHVHTTPHSHEGIDAPKTHTHRPAKTRIERRCLTSCHSSC